MSDTIRVLDLFSGIGGFSLGLKRAGGFETIAYCEINPYCQSVLQARMQDGTLDYGPICTDVQRLDGTPFKGFVDLICGGFPCQDISHAGRRVGIDGQRSGLWKEIARLVREIRPRYVFVENVSALLIRGMGTVLGDLAAIGYDAEWEVIPAAALGAPHLRERVWIVAYPAEQSKREQTNEAFAVATQGQARDESGDGGELVAHPNGAQGGHGHSRVGAIFGHPEKAGRHQIRRSECWATEPAVGRVADGVPDRVDRLRVLGNAVVPQVVEWIGRRIMKDFSSERRNDA
jgi:DNA (cytosine-5)-methyltransferase 1